MIQGPFEQSLTVHVRMATPPYPGNNYYNQASAPPPPPGYAPQAGGYYQQPAKAPKAHTSHGLLGSLSSIGRDAAKALSTAATDVDTMYSRNVHGDLLAQFKTGTVVVLVSRMSGRSLQIVQAPDGRLIVDAACVDSPQVFNNKWSVTKVRNGVYTLSNYNNFLSVQGGHLVVLVGMANSTCEFKLSQSEHFVMLESALTRGQFVAVTERGEVKPPVATSNDKYSQFGVLFVSVPQGM